MYARYGAFGERPCAVCTVPGTAEGTDEGDSRMLSERQKIELIMGISLDINEAKDVDLLLEKILPNVRRFFNADAGSIYLKEGELLKFSHTRNATLKRRLEKGRKLIYNTFTIPINTKSGRSIDGSRGGARISPDG